jgi:hypothetical protein
MNKLPALFPAVLRQEPFDRIPARHQKITVSTERPQRQALEAKCILQEGNQFIVRKRPPRRIESLEEPPDPQKLFVAG